MPTIDLPQGTLEYRVAGPEGASGPPVVFVHGFLVDGSLWTGVADALAAAGVRSYAPTWPLGSHRSAMRSGADQTPRGVARTLLDFLDALGLEDVTLVGNDSGGALCQFVLDTDDRLVGRLVLTNCDAFEAFPPFPFDRIFGALSTPARLRFLMTAMRPTALRHSPLGFGLLARRLDAVQTRRWITPLLGDAGVRRDASTFVRAASGAELLDVSTRLHRFTRPVLLVWGDADRFFRIASAHRLARTFPDARVVPVPGGLTFLPLDEPARVAEAIVGFVGHGAAGTPTPVRAGAT